MERYVTTKAKLRTPKQLAKGVLKQMAIDQMLAAGLEADGSFILGGVTIKGSPTVNVDTGRIMVHYSGKRMVGDDERSFNGNDFTGYVVKGWREAVVRVGYEPADGTATLSDTDLDTGESV